MPPYLRIAGELRERIVSGDLAPGAMLPSIRRLAQEYDVALITAQKALRVLREEGLTYSVQGWGTFVKARD
jgi:DNA-binding GntR family transcriptional regulator